MNSFDVTIHFFFLFLWLFVKPPGQDSEWVDIVESELRSILEPRDVPAMAHSTLSESVSSVTPPLPPLSPHDSPRTPRNRYTAR